MGLVSPVMSTIVFFLLVGSAVCVPMSPTVPLGDTTGHSHYKPVGQDHYAPNEVYKAGDMNDCHYVDKLVYKDECVPYVEQTCYTQQEEYCEDVYEKNCTAVIDEFEERECFEVTELQCHLSESIEYEVVQEQYTVLRCTRTSDRVCDTVYDLAVSTRDDFQCIDVSTSTVGMRKRSSRTGPASSQLTLSVARASQRMVKAASTATRCQPRSATTLHARSGKRCASHV